MGEVGQKRAESPLYAWKKGHESNLPTWKVYKRLRRPRQPAALQLLKIEIINIDFEKCSIVKNTGFLVSFLRRSKD